MEANSISDVLKLVEEFFKTKRLSSFGLWFRGQNNFNYNLRPSILRQGKDYGGKAIQEMELYREFKLLKTTQEYHNKTTFEWLILMQHYGLPTRLLDWSQNLLVGLYFATEVESIDGAFYALEPLSLNFSSDRLSGFKMFDHVNTQVKLRANLVSITQLKDFLKLEEVKNIYKGNGVDLKIVDDKLDPPWFQSTIESAIAVRPPIQNDRIFLQRGVFTLHGGKIEGDKKIFEPVHIEDLDDVNIIKIKIPKSSKSIVRKELEYCGINEATLFPELEYQSKYILKRWS